VQPPTTTSGSPVHEQGVRTCPACGAANGLTAAFCLQCKHPLDVEITIDAGRVLRSLLIVIGALAVLSPATQAMAYYLPEFPGRDLAASLFYMDNEQNVPTLCSTLLLLVSAILCAMIAHAHHRERGSYVPHWVALALIFSVLALDEFASMHERATLKVRALLGIESGALRWAWVVPAGLAVVIFVFVYLRFLGHLPRSTRRGLWAAGILFVGGAIGFEVLSGPSYVPGAEEQSMAYVFLTTLEETLELLGVTLLVYTLVSYIPLGLPGARWRLRVAEARSFKAKPMV